MEKDQIECTRKLVKILQEYQGVKVEAAIGKFLYEQWHREYDEKDKIIENEIAERLKKEYHKCMPYDHNGWYGDACLQGVHDFLGARALPDEVIKQMQKENEAKHERC